ncbi:hypothetical protein FRC0505_02430 [Corynebacterium diphtheriae]|nr:hypothetical protein FRC0050_00140 [Corynebacterium diphtheriae]CAB0674651.1 hypothetical protein FRC0049_00140 [Corynebacterium diphtheriae]CAB0866981.1 hypothetical protein FRC0314_02369 [Corynebacterium diphtheriae]CAB0893847.1 hypothetical protein FRC0408_02315 [Corynebacterium diphtheriae]CAB0981635.1 hypothetical protein FRC0508_00187 [Corynebacterium diphtheriae]
MLHQVRTSHPHAFIFDEVIHGDYAQIVADNSMDSVTQYELWKAICSSLKDENFFELDWCIKRHMEWADSFIPQTFVGNHDVSRIASVVGCDKAITAACILFTLPGYPQRLGGDDAVRPEFHPWLIDASLDVRERFATNFSGVLGPVDRLLELKTSKTARRLL